MSDSKLQAITSLRPVIALDTQAMWRPTSQAQKTLHPMKIRHKTSISVRARSVLGKKERLARPPLAANSPHKRHVPSGHRKQRIIHIPNGDPISTKPVRRGVERQPLRLLGGGRPLHACILLNHFKANPKYPMPIRATQQFEITHGPMLPLVKIMPTTPRLWTGALRARKSKNQDQQNQGQITIHQLLVIQSAQDSLQILKRKSLTRLARHGGQHRHAQHELTPKHATKDGIRLVLQDHPSPHAPHVSGNARIDQLSLIHHRRHPCSQLATPGRVTRLQQRRPCTRLAIRSPPPVTHHHLLPRRWRQMIIHNFLHAALHIERQTIPNGSRWVSHRHSLRRQATRSRRTVLRNIAGIGIQQLTQRVHTRLQRCRHGNRAACIVSLPQVHRRRSQET